MLNPPLLVLGAIIGALALLRGLIEELITNAERI